MTTYSVTTKNLTTGKTSDQGSSKKLSQAIQMFIQAAASAQKKDLTAKQIQNVNTSIKTLLKYSDLPESGEAIYSVKVSGFQISLINK